MQRVRAGAATTSRAGRRPVLAAATYALQEDTMDALRVVSLLAATVSMGLVAGVFGPMHTRSCPAWGGPTTGPSQLKLKH